MSRGKIGLSFKLLKTKQKIIHLGPFDKLWVTMNGREKKGKHRSAARCQKLVKINTGL
jgi:hypothetical protein